MGGNALTKYEAIINYIKNEIKIHNIKSGEKLPSTRSITQKFKCSKVTAVKAYDLMKKEHLVYSIPKSGYYFIGNKLTKKNEVQDNQIDFATANPDRSILPYDEFQHCINSAIDLYKDSLFSNSDAQGLPSLIDVIINQLHNYQVFTRRENLFITSGSQQAINILTMMNFNNDKESVLVEEPTYYGVIKTLELNRVKIIGIKRNCYGIDFNELERIFKYDKIKFFYTIPRFHNPSGFSYSNKDKKIILQLCKKYNVYIVEDDYLGDLEINMKSDPIYSLDTDSKVIYLKSYSKVMLPGLRISAAVLPNSLAKTFREYKRWNDLNSSVLSQGTLEIYIKSGMFDRNMKKLREVYTARMNHLKEVTNSTNNSNIKWYVPESGFFASFEIDSRVNIKCVIDNLKKKNVLLFDNSKCFLTKNENNRLMRLSVSRVDKEKINKGINKIIDEIK